MLSSNLPFHFNEDDQLYSLHNAPEIPEPFPLSPQPTSAPVMRQCAVAHVIP